MRRSTSPQTQRTRITMTENELLAMMKNIIPIGNAGTPAKLAVRRAQQDSLVVSFYGEKDANEWGEKYNVIMTAEEARTMAAWLLQYANCLDGPPMAERRKMAA
jgi:hypothetical protein